MDAHNIVPCWEASDKAEEAAYLMRGKLQKHVHNYMMEFPPVVPHPFPIETQVTECMSTLIQLCFGITYGRVLNGELYAQ